MIRSIIMMNSTETFTCGKCAQPFGLCKTWVSRARGQGDNIRLFACPYCRARHGWPKPGSEHPMPLKEYPFSDPAFPYWGTFLCTLAWLLGILVAQAVLNNAGDHRIPLWLVLCAAFALGAVTAEVMNKLSRYVK